MKWKIKPGWIKKEYSYDERGIYWANLKYHRLWNDILWKRNLAIKCTSTKKSIHKMIETLFNHENNKKSFKNLKAYHIINTENKENEVLLDKDGRKCRECHEKLSDDKEFYVYFSHSKELSSKYVCKKCYELNRQIKKLKE